MGSSSSWQYEQRSCLLYWSCCLLSFSTSKLSESELCLRSAEGAEREHPRMELFILGAMVDLRQWPCLLEVGLRGAWNFCLGLGVQAANPIWRISWTSARSARIVGLAIVGFGW